MHRPDAIADREVAHVGADGEDDAGRLVPGDNRELLEGEAAFALDEVAMADATSLNLDEDLIALQARQVRRDPLVNEALVPAVRDETDPFADRGHVSPVRRAIASR
jgi:hypothetical protein